MWRLRPDITPEKVYELYKAGKKVKDMATDFGVTPMVICNRLRTAGVPSGLNKRLDINAGDVRKLFEGGISVTALARKYETSPALIRKRLKGSGLSEIHSMGHHMHGGANPRWGGGRVFCKGYYYIYKPDHPRAKLNKKYVTEHIVVWEEYHKQPLPQGWLVHHINGIKSDNRPRNLLALPRQKHQVNSLLLEAQKRLREMEIENKQLCRAFENSQSIFYISEN